MHLRLIAVGDRQPDWVDSAVADYAARLPREWRFRIDLVGTARRSKRQSADSAIAAEADQVLHQLKSSERLILLDERGEQFDSRNLAAHLARYEQDGADLALLIGGPDGVSEAIRERAEAVWGLSRLTLPHGLARVTLLEQLYRAWSIRAGHPYHRD